MLLLLVIADRVGSALVHQRLLERHGEHLAHLREVRALVDEQRPGREPHDILARVSEAACRVPGVRAALALAGSGPTTITAAAGAGRLRSVGPEQIPPDDELLAEGFAADRPVAIRDLQARSTARPGVLERDGLRAGLLVPLRSRGRVLGLLALADVEPREFSAEEVEMALTLAAVTAVALDSRRGLEDLRQALGEQAARQAELAEGEKARVLTALGAGLTRELSAVFALLLGKSQLMLARAPDESLREGLAALEEAAWRGTDVTQRLLGLAEADRAADLSCDLGAIAQEALAFARPRPGAAAPAGGRIEMTADLPPTPPVGVSATALREAVVNLVLNAMEAMPAGGTRDRAATRRSSDGVELVVADSGARHRAGGEAAHLRSLLHDASRAPGPRAHRRPGGRAPRGRTASTWPAVPAGTTVTLWLPTARGERGADGPTKPSRASRRRSPLSRPARRAASGRS